MILQLTILFLVSIIIAWAGGAYLLRKYNIPKSRWSLYKPVHKVQGIVEIFIFVSFIIMALFAFENVFYSVVIFILTLNAFRAFMEWKFARETKRYIVVLFELGLLLLFIGAVYAVVL